MGDFPKILNLDTHRSGRLMALLVVGLAWFAVIRMVWNDWRIDPQYSYGVLVPLLVLGLLMKRWEERPVPLLLGRGPRIIIGALILMSAMLLALLIPMSEANPDWRPLGGAAALAAIVITLCLITLEGGLPWLKHFAFPVLFFLIAVPWPRNLEQSMMSFLMSWNATTTVEILHWLGYEAVRQGNLIVIPAGVLGVEEACSGVRSLQSGLMVALFFGEIFRLTLPRRFFLLFAALLAALLGNILRSSFLGILASRQGMAAIPEWHDSAGMAVLLLTIVIIFGIAFFWRCPVRSSQQHGERQHGAAPIGMGNPSLTLLSAALLLLAVTMLLTEAWFRIHDLPSGDNWGWQIEPRTKAVGVSQVTVPPATLRMLFYPRGFSEKWMGASGEVGQVFFFEWPAGRTALQSVQIHSPDVCLVSMGMHLEKPLADVNIGSGTSGGLPLHAWLFTQNGRPVYVFHSILEEDGRRMGETIATDQATTSRLDNLRLGKRNRGQRMIEIAFWNLHDESEARAALASYFADSLMDKPSSFLQIPQIHHE